ncbi:hypothetical protein GW17_00061796, partial [Ensete ventricosum]
CEYLGWAVWCCGAQQRASTTRPSNCKQPSRSGRHALYQNRRQRNKSVLASSSTLPIPCELPASETISERIKKREYKRREGDVSDGERCRSRRGFVTAVAAVACVSVNALFAVRSFRHGSDVLPPRTLARTSFSNIIPLISDSPVLSSFGQIFGGIFRCYAVAISLFVAVAETEWGFVIKIWRVRFDLLFCFHFEFDC